MQPLRIEAKFARPLNFADFDKKSMRKGFTQVGRDVSKIAKKLVRKKGVSAAGAYPGKQTGIFQKAISYKVSRSGFSVAVKPYGKGKQVAAELTRRGCYPAVVVFGHAGPKRSKRTRAHRKQSFEAKVAKPRANPVSAAAETYGRTRFQAVVGQILENAFKPGPIRSLMK